jgi:fermentation-respiration switch protein FrsA (DUF1100 family)
VVSPTLDEEVFYDLLGEFVQLDFHCYVEHLRCLAVHDAWTALPSITVPTLVIAGEHDMMTPWELAKKMAGQVPGADFYLVRGATHYAPVEYPDLLNLRVEKFFREKGLLPGPAPASAPSPAAPRKARAPKSRRAPARKSGKAAGSRKK